MHSCLLSMRVLLEGEISSVPLRIKQEFNNTHTQERGCSGGSAVKNLPTNAVDKGSIPGLEDPLEKAAFSDVGADLAETPGSPISSQSSLSSPRPQPCVHSSPWEVPSLLISAP